MGSADQKVVLITGAAQGLGRALADKFLSERWQVIATDKDVPAMNDLKDNPDVLTLQMDVTSDEEVRSAFEKVSSGDISLDVIINNAGIDNYFPFSETPVANFREVIETNVFGAYRVNQVFLPLLKKPGGRIIHIGSESLKITAPFMPYPLSKNLLERYARVLRQELSFRGIEVVVIRPGAIRTRLLENVMNLKMAVGSRQSAVGSQQSVVGQKAWFLQRQFEKFAEMAPENIGKVAEPEEIAAFIYKVSQKDHPKAVYRINNNPLLKIMAILPTSLIERAVKRKLSG